MKKFILCLTMALLLAVVAPISAFAYSKDLSGSAVFDGKAITSNFADVEKEVRGIQPGDSVTMTVTLKNSYTETTDWYMSNKVLESLEATAKNKGKIGGAYSYHLSFVDAKGTTVNIFDSDNVGGTNSQQDVTSIMNNSIGLNQATNALQDFFFLDRLEPNQTAKVILTVKFEGETIANDYQDTLAKLKMNFAVELAKPGAKPFFSAPRTGDSASIMTYSMIALGAGVVCMILLFVRVKNNRKEAKAKVQRGGR